MKYLEYYELGNTVCSEIVQYCNFISKNPHIISGRFCFGDIYSVSDYRSCYVINTPLISSIFIEFGIDSKLSWHGSLGNNFNGIWCRHGKPRLSPIGYSYNREPKLLISDGTININPYIEFHDIQDLMFSLSTVMCDNDINLLSCWFGLRDSAVISETDVMFNILNINQLNDVLDKLKIQFGQLK